MVTFYMRLKIANNNDGGVTMALPFDVKSGYEAFVSRAFKATGTYIAAYGASGGVYVVTGTGSSDCQIQGEYICD